MAKTIILALLICCRYGWALNPSLDISQYAHTSWKISEAFGEGTIWAIAQTPDGYLWLSMESGLRRFDGVRTVLWQPPAGEHLLTKGMRNLISARDGTLWIGTGKELVSWKDGKLTHYPELDGHDITALLEDREGTIWAAGKIWEAGPAQPGKVCTIKSGRVQCFGSDGRFGFAVTGIHEDSRGTLWLGAANGLWRWKPGPPEHYPMPEFDENNLLFPKRAFLDDGQGGLLITGPRGIRRFKDGKFSPYPLPSGAPQFKHGEMLRDRDGGLWIGTLDTGLLHVHQGRVDVFTEAEGLTNHFIQNLFEDREGNIWVGGLSGLDCFRDYAVPTLSVRQGLSSAYVKCVLGTGDGSVWIGTSDGLNRWKDGQITVYRKRTGATKSHQPGANVHELNPDGLPDNNISSLYQEADGRLWVSTGRGPAYFEGSRFVLLSREQLPDWWSDPVARDNAGNLWMSTDHGLYRLSGGRVAEHFPSSKLGLSGSISTLLAVDPLDGGLWVGSWEGGVVYFKDGQVRASYRPADGLGEGRVNALELDSENTLWAPTDSGLSRIKNDRVATLTSKNGLPCDAAHGVVEDDAHSLWTYMACGLVRISRPELDAWAADPKRQIQVTAFDISDGVKSHSGALQYAPRMTRSADGRVWFAPLDGVSFVDPRHLPINKLPPPVHIEQITADHKLRWQNWSGGAASNLHLPALSRDLEIDYTALSLTVPEKVRFKYKLEGYDSDWQDAGDRRQAFYTNLSPKSYRFRVMACNNSGVWNETGDTLDFTIERAYYQSHWFHAGVATCCYALLFVLYRRRLRRLAHEYNLRAEERVEERTRIARDLHDTLLQTFHGLMLRLQVVDELLPPGRAKSELEETLEFGDQAVVEARNAVHDLRSSATTSNDLAQALRTMGTELARETTARFRLVAEGRARDLNPIVRDEIYRIAREALRNAVAHGAANHIEAEIIYDEQLIRLRVRDDGKGIPSEVLERGRAGHYGLAGMRERARSIGAKLKIGSGQGIGTEIEVTVPGPIAYGKPTGWSRLWPFGRFMG
jgi:signal transduction histidine kinase/ligand-binding sensor domain-containing protein